MKQFHVNDKGEVKPCGAKAKPCRFRDNAPHFSTQKEGEEYLAKSEKRPTTTSLRREKARGELNTLAQRGVQIKKVHSVAQHDFHGGAAGESTVDLVEEKPSPEMLRAIRSGKLPFQKL